MADLIHADPGEIVFTSCGTESDNSAVFSALNANPDKKRIITSNVEHPAILNLFKYLQDKKGYDAVFITVDEKGRLDLDMLYDSLSDDTAIVSLMWANNETGVIFPIPEIAEKVTEKGILFHTDAVQAAGKIPIDVTSANVDLLSLSGHKIHAPKGVGVLYVKKGIKISPLPHRRTSGKGSSGRYGKHGIHHRSGKACELAAKHLPVMDTQVKELRNYLQNHLLEKIPGVSVNGDPENGCPIPCPSDLMQWKANQFC